MAQIAPLPERPGQSVSSTNVTKGLTHLFFVFRKQLNVSLSKATMPTQSRWLLLRTIAACISAMGKG